MPFTVSKWVLDSWTFDLERDQAIELADRYVGNNTAYVIADLRPSEDEPAKYAICSGNFPAGCTVAAIYTPVGTLVQSGKPQPIGAAMLEATEQKQRTGRPWAIVNFDKEPHIWRAMPFDRLIYSQMSTKPQGWILAK